MSSKRISKRLKALEDKTVSQVTEERLRLRAMLAKMTFPELRNLRSVAEKANEDSQLISDPTWRAAHLTAAESAALEHYEQLCEQEFQ